MKLNGVTNVVGSDDVMRSLCDSDAKLSCFMNCVYWGRLVENLFCVVSIENDCPDQDCLSRVLVITRFIICVERFEHLMRSQ